MDIPQPDYVIPAVIVAGCIILMVVVARLTRERPQGWDFPPAEPVASSTTSARVDVEALRAWHATHGPTIVRWIEAHEYMLEVLGRSGLLVDRTEPMAARRTELTPAIKNAVTSHPSPRMRAELSAMRVAAESTLYAVQRADYRTAESQHVTYIDYRNQWLHRLHQFADDEITVGELRDLADTEVSLPTDPAEGGDNPPPRPTQPPPGRSAEGGNNPPPRPTQPPPGRSAEGGDNPPPRPTQPPPGRSAEGGDNPAPQPTQPSPGRSAEGGDNPA